MGRLLNIVTPLHKRAKRDCLARMVDDKVHCMLKAKEYEFDYWDGDRRYGYGGYKYDGRWKVVAEKLIAIYGLKPGRQDPRCRLRQGPPALRTEAAAAQVGLRRLRHLKARPGRRPRRHPRQPLPLPGPGRLSLRRQVLRPGHFAGLPAQLAALRAEDGAGGNRARRQEQLRHARKLPQRAGIVQSAVLGADRPNRSSTRPSGSGSTSHFGYTGDYEFIYFE